MQTTAFGSGLVGDIPADGTAGAGLFTLAGRLYPINRSITGNGVRQTLRILSEIAPFEIRDIASGTPVLDWTVPPEWNVRAAYIADSHGRRIVDVAAHSLHLVGYSIPVDRKMTLAELRPHLHALPDKPDLIPYRTSYYNETWGFCLPYRQLAALADGTYHVVIDTSLDTNGSLTYGELYLPGDSEDEVLLSAHICHPSLANDNCSGLAIAAWLGRMLGQRRRRLSYRILLAPGTIGSITWLALNRDRVGRIRHGLTLSNLGDGGGPTYKRSRRGTAPVDRAAEIVLRHAGPSARVLNFSPYGYDERQYGSPGFDLAVGSLQRSAWGTFPEYHTSADNLDFIAPEHLEGSLRLVAAILDVIEGDDRPVSTMPYGEPQLGRRGLYDGHDGRPLPEEVRMALLWVLNLADGQHSLVDMAERSGLAFGAVRRAADRLLEAGLLRGARTEALGHAYSGRQP
ncbi:MAG: DUF4910 domain-containing protein [Hyphomicrobiaceae bacterium]